MRFHKSFRFRIFLSLWTFGIVLVILYTVLAALLMRLPSVTTQKVYSELSAEWASACRNYKSGGSMVLPQSRFIKSFTDISDLPSRVQQQVSAMNQGNARVSFPGENGNDVYYISVQEHPDHGSPVYMLYDYDRQKDEAEANFKNRAYRRFSTAFYLIVVLSFMVGLVSSKRIIAPLKKLSMLVETSGPENLPMNLSKGFPENEIGALAQSFENAMRRIQAFIEREKKFSRDASHELRTPVATIGTAVELIRDIPESKDKKFDRLLRRIERSLKNMEVIIETFLWLGCESRLIDEDEVTRIRDVVSEAVEENRYLIREKPISVHTDIRDDVFIRAPEPILKIAVVNLIRNAFYHTHDGEITIFSNDEYFEIRDTGIGIESKDLEKSEHSKGFGQGLSIVERLCKRFDWLLDISSDTKNGTRVRITFS